MYHVVKSYLQRDGQVNFENVAIRASIANAIIKAKENI